MKILNYIGSAFFTGMILLFIYLILFIGKGVVVGFLEIVGFVLSFLALLLSICLRWTSVEESTAMAVMRFGKFQRMLFVKKDHNLDNNYDLQLKKGYKYPFFGDEWLGELLGGLRFYVWPFEYIYTYAWDWLKSMPNGEIVPRHRGPEDPEGPEDHILVGYDYPYGMKMGEGVVTSDNYPVEATIILRGQVTNPYQALFDVKWFEQLTAGTRPAVKDYINSHTYEQIIVEAGKTVHDELYDDIDARGVIKLLKGKYGFELRSVGFSKIVLTPEHLKLALQQKQGEMDAARDAAKRLGSTTRPFFDMLAKETALEPKDLAKILRNPVQAKKFRENNKEAIERCERFINRQIDADAGALKSFHFSGGSPGMDLIALLGEAFRGGGGSSGTGSSSSKPDNPSSSSSKSSGGKSDDELSKEADKLLAEIKKRREEERKKGNEG